MSKFIFTEEELDYIALCIIQAIHVYALQGNNNEERYKNVAAALTGLRNDSKFYQKPHILWYDLPFATIMKRIERVGKENGYWED